MEIQSTDKYLNGVQQLSHAEIAQNNKMENVATFPHASLLRSPISSVPLGLQALYDHCFQAYPNQANPLQVTAVIKFWLEFKLSFYFIFWY